MRFVEYKICYVAGIGHCSMICKQGDQIGVATDEMLRACRVKMIPSSMIQKSVKDFRVGQIICYNNNKKDLYKLTAKELDSNLLVCAKIQTNGRINTTQRVALVPDKCSIITREQLRVVIVNENNEIVDELSHIKGKLIIKGGCD